MKRLSADDSMDTHVKVGHCQTPISKSPGKSGAFAITIRLRYLGIERVRERRGLRKESEKVEERSVKVFEKTLDRGYYAAQVA